MIHFPDMSISVDELQSYSLPLTAKEEEDNLLDAVNNEKKYN